MKLCYAAGFYRNKGNTEAKIIELKPSPEVLMCHSEFLEYKEIGISFVLSVLKYFHLNADFDFPYGTR